MQTILQNFRSFTLLLISKSFFQAIFSPLLQYADLSTKNVTLKKHVTSLTLKKYADGTIKAGRHEKRYFFIEKFNNQKYIYRRIS